MLIKRIPLIGLLIIFATISVATQSFAQQKRIVAWDGETARKGAGWTNPSATCTVEIQTKEFHSPNAAVEFRFKGDGKSGWQGCGWDWAAFQVGEYGTDISAM